MKRIDFSRFPKNSLSISRCRKADVDHQFLRDTLNFGDGLIKKLFMFNDVTIKVELYYTEFRQHFKTDGLIKETSDGKFDLKIDGISHVRWFRRKKYEFMKHWDCLQGNKIEILNCKSKQSGLLYHVFLYFYSQIEYIIQ